MQFWRIYSIKTQIIVQMYISLDGFVCYNKKIENILSHGFKPLRALGWHRGFTGGLAAVCGKRALGLYPHFNQGSLILFI